MPRATKRAPTHTRSAADYIPPSPTLSKLKTAAAGCRGCDLWKLGSQTVFGEGPKRARVMFVGEQPGDQEDRAGHPFVGPAGQLLDRALEAAGLERDEVYVTNAVKHFKWERGAKSTRRIHKKPNDREIRACRPWLDQELALVKPEIVVCLGATAAQALLGRSFRVTRERGKRIRAPFGIAVATVHPSSVLRAIDGDARRRETKAFFADIRKVVTYLEQPRERTIDEERPLPRAVEPEAERGDGSRTSRRSRRTSERDIR